jgi:hypothetical protein
MVERKKNVKLSKSRKIIKKKASISKKPLLKKKHIKSIKIKKSVTVKKHTPTINHSQSITNNYSTKFKKNNFTKFRRGITFDTYFQFLWFLLYILLFVLFCDFIIKLAVYSIASNAIIYHANFTFSYQMYTSMILLTFFLIYFLFAYEASRINVKFNVLFKGILNLSIFLYVVESVLFIISYFSFLKSYYLLFNITSFYYLYYCLFWILIKYIILLFVTVVAYRLFKKLKRKYIWY